MRWKLSKQQTREQSKLQPLQRPHILPVEAVPRARRGPQRPAHLQGLCRKLFCGDTRSVLSHLLFYEVAPSCRSYPVRAESQEIPQTMMHLHSLLTQHTKEQGRISKVAKPVCLKRNIYVLQRTGGTSRLSQTPN